MSLSNALPAGRKIYWVDPRHGCNRALQKKDIYPVMEGLSCHELMSNALLAGRKTGVVFFLDRLQN
jgi:hypothetical protein